MADSEAEKRRKLALTRQYERLIRETIGLGRVNSVPGDTAGRTHVHEGLDIGRPFNSLEPVDGREVRAAAGGRVVRTDPINGFRNAVVIERTLNGQRVTDIYGHLQDGSLPAGLTLGDTVSHGDVLGRVGATGGSYTPHLHYETHQADLDSPMRAASTGPLWSNGKPPVVDPLDVQDFPDLSRYTFGIEDPRLRRQVDAHLRAKFDRRHTGEVRGHGSGFDRAVREEAVRKAASTLTIDQLVALSEEDFSWATQGDYWRRLMDPDFQLH